LKKDFIANRLRSGKKSIENPIERKIETIEGKGFSWIDLQNPDRAYVEDLAKKYHFNTLNIEDCMTKFELPKLDSYDEHFFVILHFPPISPKVGIAKNSQLSIFFGRDFLVTVHQGDLKPLVDLVDLCKTNSDPQRKERLLGKSSGLLLHEIIDLLVDDLLHTSRRIIANLDEMEDPAEEDLELPESALGSEEELADSNLEIEIITNKRKYPFHYQVIEGRLLLYGDFDEEPYELLEINVNSQKKLYLFFKKQYYEIEKDTTEISPLQGVSNKSLIRELEKIKNKDS